MTDARDERRVPGEGNGDLASVYETELEALSGKSVDSISPDGDDTA